uniref:Zinc finger protein klf1 n=1 Tax=Talaromyces marneffei PM1 TaxID=1077442 RepID=A0A093ULZ9_TALMA
MPSSSSTPPESTPPEQHDDVLQDTVPQTLPVQTSHSRFDSPLTPEQESNSASGEVDFPRHARPAERRNFLQPESSDFTAYYAGKGFLPSFTTQSQSDIEESIIYSLSRDDVPASMNPGSGGPDWLDFQLQEPTMQQESSAMTSTSHSVIPLIDFNIGNSQGYGNNTAGLEVHDPGTVSVDSIGNFTNLNSQSLPTSQQWLFDQNRERFPPRCQLPPLRDILHGSIASAYGRNVAALEELVQLLSVSYIPRLDNSSYDWIDREREKRVTWASFEYDCSRAALTGRRGAVDLGEFPLRFPCAEALWEAPSAQAWRSLSLHSYSGISVATALERVMAGRLLPNGLSSWGKRLCSQIIGRLLSDIKQLEVAYLSKALRLPSLLSVQQQAKLALLEGFENLGRSTENPVSSKELIDHV